MCNRHCSSIDCVWLNQCVGLFLKPCTQINLRVQDFPIYIAVVHEHVYELCAYITGIVQLNGFALVD
jgi:hypothetical protein